MKEFVEKLIERLEEKQKIDLVYANEKLQFFNDAAYERYVTFMKAIQIVKDLASEHNNGFCEWEIVSDKDIDREYKPMCSEDGFIQIT